MATANRLRRAARWFAGAGALIFPACASFDPEPAVAPVSRVSVDPRPLPTALQKPVAKTAPPVGRKPSPAAVVPASATVAAPPALPTSPAADGKPLPIDLPTALGLADASPIDVRIAGERLKVAAAEYDRAKVAWLPNLGLGVEYYGHAGRIQDIAGKVFPTDRQALLVGAGPTAVFATGDALYAPLAARQLVRAREADVRTARNDAALEVAEAYFAVQQARGEVAGSLDALRRAEELVKLTEKVAPDLTPTVEINRARAEVARRRFAVEAAYERWETAGADLTRVLRLEPGTVVEPAENPALVVELTDPSATPADLIPVALTHRPELAADQAVIQAALARVKQEKMRPYLPNVAVRGLANQAPGLAGGLFGGGEGDQFGNFGARFSMDVQAIWEVQNLGFGNRASVRTRQAEERVALLQLLRTQDRVTAEVVQAHARVHRAANRLKAAAGGVADAAETADKNLRGLVPGKRVGDQLVLVFRPQEAVAAVAALDQAYRDYYAAVADHNRAQFQLRRALGSPPEVPAATTAPPPSPPAPAPAADPAPAPTTNRRSGGYLRGAVVAPPESPPPADPAPQPGGRSEGSLRPATVVAPTPPAAAASAPNPAAKLAPRPVVPEPVSVHPPTKR